MQQGGNIHGRGAFAGMDCLRVGDKSDFMLGANDTDGNFPVAVGSLPMMFRPTSYLFSNPVVLCEVIKSDRYMKAYAIADVEFRPHVDGMKFRNVKLGDGEEVQRGDSVNVHFTGRLLGGKEIESTESLPGRKMTIKAGGSGVVRVVSEGVIGMKEYGSREFIVPPNMHYPDRFPNQIMIYELMVRTINK